MFCPEKKIHGQKVATRIILDVMRTKKCCRDVQLGLWTFQCLCYSSELKIFLILEPPLNF